MKVFSFCCGPFETNCYVVDFGAYAVIIDPAPGSKEKILRCVEENGLKVREIWLTHSHIDHIGDLAEVKEALGVPVYVHRDDWGNVEEPGSDGLPLMFPVKRCDVDGDFSGIEGVEVIETPGHTPGGVSFYFKDEGILFSGDTLFHGSIGNLSFPTAEPEKMWISLEKLSKLPPETTFYPGHGEASTIGAETWLKDAKKIFGEMI